MNTGDLLREICKQQDGGNYILLGFYLSPCQIAEVESQLLPGLELPESRGEFRGIAVYESERTPVPRFGESAEVRGIRFTYHRPEPNLPMPVDFDLFDLFEFLRSVQQH